MSGNRIMRCSSLMRRRIIRRSRSPCWWKTAATALPPQRRWHAKYWTFTCSESGRKAPFLRVTTNRKPMIKRLWHYLTAHIDGFLFGAVCLLMLLGLFVLYSATGQDLAKTSNQFASMLIALAVMWAVSDLPPQHLMRLSLPVYALGMALLIAVALFGDVVNGARRWLHIGVTRIHPAEIMNIAVPLMLAWYFDKHETALRFKNYVVAIMLLLVPVALIARQPDLGTAILITASGFYVLFLAGLSWRIMLSILVLGLASLPVLWSVLHDYQRQRILTLLDPSTDPLGAGYHTIQSTIAVGSGGATGQGWLNGTQSHLEFLP